MPIANDENDVGYYQHWLFNFCFYLAVCTKFSSQNTSCSICRNVVAQKKMIVIEIMSPICQFNGVAKRQAYMQPVSGCQFAQLISKKMKPIFMHKTLGLNYLWLCTKFVDTGEIELICSKLYLKYFGKIP